MSARFYTFIFAGAIIAATAFFLFAGGDNAAASRDNPTVAVVNGEEIKRSEIMDVMNNVPPGLPITAEQIFPMVIDQMITEKLLQKEAAKSGLENDPEFRKMMEEAKKQILKNMYLERKMKEIVDAKQIKSEYQRLIKEHTGMEETRASHILVETRDEALELIKKLDAGGDFAALARAHSKDPEAANGGDLGYFTSDEIAPEFGAAAAKIKKGAYAKEPVQTQFGWHVVKVEDRRKRPAPKLEEVEDMIRNQLGQKALEKYVQELRAGAEIKRFTFDGEPLN